MNSKVKPLNGTQAIYTPNGIADATLIPNYNAIDGDALFKLSSNIPGPNTYNGINVNMGIISHKLERWSPTSISNTEIQFEAFTTNNFPVRHMYLDLPVMFCLAENIWGGSIKGDLTRADLPTAAWKTGQVFSSMTKDWSGYSVPYGAISRLINKLYFKLGGLVDITNTYEQTSFGLSITSMDHLTGINSTEDILKTTCGDAMSYRNIGNLENNYYRKMKQDSGDPGYMAGSFMHDSTNYSVQPSKFLDNFNCLLYTKDLQSVTTRNNIVANGGLWATRLRIPLAMLVPVLQSDMIFGPNIKVYIRLELPIFNSQINPLPLTCSVAGYANWKNFGLWNLLAKRNYIAINTLTGDEAAGTNLAFSTTNVAVPNETKTTNCLLGDHTTGLLGTTDLSRTAFINMTYYVLVDSIAADLLKIRIYKPMVLNNETLTVYPIKLDVSQNFIQFQIQPNANLPQELFIGIVNISNAYSLPTTGPYFYPSNPSITVNTKTGNNQLGANVLNPLFIFENDPLPFLVKRLQIDFGNAPNIDYNREVYEPTSFKQTIVGNQYYNPTQASFMLGKLPLEYLHSEIMAKSYLDRTLNTSQQLPYSDFKKPPGIMSTTPEVSTWFRTVLVPDSVQRGGSAADNSSHVINVSILFDTGSPYWNVFKEMINTDTRIITIRKTLSQFTMDAAGNASTINWPAILISGGRAGETERVVGNPPNGAFQ